MAARKSGLVTRHKLAPGDVVAAGSFGCRSYWRVDSIGKVSFKASPLEWSRDALNEPGVFRVTGAARIVRFRKSGDALAPASRRPLEFYAQPCVVKGLYTP
jgi:hypothetical protein